MLNSFSDVLMRDFSINSIQMGNLVATFFYSNFLLVFPAGLIIDRFSMRKIILWAMFFLIISVFGFAFAHHLWLASISRLIAGAAGGFAFLASVGLASKWFPPRKMAFVTGIIVTFAMLGGTFAQTPMVILSHILGGWRAAMLVIGFLGIICFIFMWFLVKDVPQLTNPQKIKNGKDILTTSEKHITFFESIYLVLSNRYNWLAGLYTTFMNLPIFVLGGAWGDLYLTQTHHNINKLEAATISAMIFFGTIVGSPLIGWISDHLKRRIYPMFFSTLLTIALFFIIIYGNHLNFLMLMILFFLLGLLTSSQILGYPVITELNSPQITGSALSIASLLIMGSGFVFPPLYGWLLNLYWNHKVFHNIPIYTIFDFKYANFITLLVPFILSLIITVFIKETYCKRTKTI